MRMRTEQTDRQREGADRLEKLENTGGWGRLMREMQCRCGGEADGGGRTQVTGQA